MGVETESDGAPVVTKVGCINHCARWAGCCDLTGGTPNIREGVLKKRACTDVPWILAMLLFTVLCVMMIWMPAIEEADLTRFLGPSDYGLNTCGYGDMKDRPFAAFPAYMSGDINVKMCVSSCDDTENFVMRTYTVGDSYIDVPVGQPSNLKFNFYCVDEVLEETFDEIMRESVIYRYMTDLYIHREAPMMAIPFTFVFLFLFFVFCKFFLKWIMYALYAGVLVGTFFGAFSFMKDGREADEAGYYTGCIILGGGLGFWCMMMCCWNALFAVVEVMQKASEALMKMPHLLLFPFLSMPFSLGIMAAWYAIVLMMFSSNPQHETMPSTVLLLPGVDETIDQVSTYKVFQSEDYDLTETFWIHLFWMLWGVKFMEYFNFVIVSGCVADWFIDRELVDNPDENVEYSKSNCSRLLGSIYRTIRYHLGTIAFASALIAILQTIEFILMYIKQQLGDTQNPFAKLVLKIAIAVVHCLKCIMDRCSKSTLVVTAVLGTPFCAGCGKSMALFFKNMALMSLGTGMIMLLCILANIVIALFAAGMSGYLYLGVENMDDLNSNLMPLLAAFIVSWFIGKLALGVWDCAATTILVSRCMLTEWYADEYGKHLGMKANKGVRNKKQNVEPVEMYAKKEGEIAEHEGP